MSTAPAPARELQGSKSWTRAQVAAACGQASPDAVYRLMATHPADPPCRCCGGFPRPFYPMGPNGFPRWLGAKVEAWLKRIHRAAQRAESGGGQQA